MPDESRREPNTKTPTEQSSGTKLRGSDLPKSPNRKTENAPSSTALVGCLRTVGSALAAIAIVGEVAPHWVSWMSERPALVVAGKPDWTWVSARGPRRSEYPPKSSPRCAG